MKSSKAVAVASQNLQRREHLKEEPSQQTLLAEAKTRQKLQLGDNPAEQLRVEEKIAKASVISQIYGEIKILLDKEKVNQHQLPLQI